MLESQEMPEHCQRTPIISHEMPRLRTFCSFTLHAPFVGKHYGYLATLTVVSHAIHVPTGLLSSSDIVAFSSNEQLSKSVNGVCDF
jgi:hypothetical protein